MLNNSFFKPFTIICMLIMISACANSKKVSINLQSDPLGAYGLMQVKYRGNENSDWIFLGPTPVNINKKIITKRATSVSLKVIRPGFYEQVKTWNINDFLKQHKKQKQIAWVPSMVKQ